MVNWSGYWFFGRYFFVGEYILRINDILDDTEILDCIENTIDLNRIRIIIDSAQMNNLLDTEKFAKYLKEYNLELHIAENINNLLVNKWIRL